MTRQSLENYIHQHIPISKALGVQVEYISSQEAIISAPFKPNINHVNTVFGGSLAAVATLSCWSLLHEYFQNLSQPVNIVVKNSEINYLYPVTNDFKAQCLLPESENWQRFLKILTDKKRARINLQAVIHQAETIAVNYQGTFAVIKL